MAVRVCPDMGKVCARHLIPDVFLRVVQKITSTRGKTSGCIKTSPPKYPESQKGIEKRIQSDARWLYHYMRQIIDPPADTSESYERVLRKAEGPFSVFVVASLGSGRGEPNVQLLDDEGRRLWSNREPWRTHARKDRLETLAALLLACSPGFEELGSGHLKTMHSSGVLPFEERRSRGFW